jgi:hypothetical protein
MKESNTTCRLCGRHVEHILELGSCYCVIKILRPFLRLAGHRSYKITDIFFAFPPDEESQGLKNIVILAWHFIIRHFYQNSEQPIAFTEHTSISKAILARFAELALGFSRIFYNTCSGTSTQTKHNATKHYSPLPSYLPQETSATHPLHSHFSTNTDSSDTYLNTSPQAPTRVLL